MELRHIKSYKSHPFASRRNSGMYRPYSNVDSFLKVNYYWPLNHIYVSLKSMMCYTELLIMTFWELLLMVDIWIQERQTLKHIFVFVYTLYFQVLQVLLIRYLNNYSFFWCVDLQNLRVDWSWSVHSIRCSWEKKYSKSLYMYSLILKKIKVYECKCKEVSWHSS